MSARNAVASAILVTLGYAAAASAQLPQHRFQNLFPLGARAGETVEVTIAGTDLEGVDGLRFGHPGIRAFLVKPNVIKVAVAPGTPPGRYDVRLTGRLGISNPRSFVVGDRPEVVEKEPNNEPAQALLLARNSVANGRMDALPDVDLYAFEGKAGERLILELHAARLDTKLDGVLRVLGPDGRQIAEAQDDYEADPFLELTLPADGKYLVKVHDVIFGGSPDHAYRLTLREGGQLDAIVPTSAAPGSPVKLTLIGRNLGGTPVPGVTIDGRPVESKPFDFTPPAIADADSKRPTADVLGSRQLGRLGWEVRPPGFANAVFLAAAADPVVVEVEPNGLDKPLAVTPPCEVSAAFGTRGDLDVYRFAAKKGQIWWVSAEAERLGSPADPTFVIQRVAADGATSDVAAAEDTPDPPGFPLTSATVDATVKFAVPEDGTYQVVVTDTYSSQRGDPRLVYRLSIHPERPDFRLFVLPVDPTNVPGNVALRAGGRVAAVVAAQRIDGFNGPIRVEARDLPPGVGCDPATIGPGQQTAPLVFSAAVDAKAGEFIPTVVGRLVSPDRKESLDYAGGASRVLAEQEHVAMAASMVHPPVQGNQNVPPAPVVRGTDGLVVAVREGAPFELTAAPTAIVAGPNETVDLAVTVVRRAPFTEAVALTTTNLPQNLAAVSGTIAKEQTTATLKLAVAANVPPGEYTILVRGAGPFPFNKDPNAKDKPNVSVTEPSNPIRITIRRP